MLLDFSQKSFSDIKKKFTENGYVFFERDYNLEEYSFFADKYGDKLIHRDSSDYGITIVKNNLEEKDGFYGLSNKALYPHTDRSTEKEAPNIVFLYCKKSSGNGGDSILIDTRHILLELISIYGEENVFTKHGNALFQDHGSSFIGNIFNKEVDCSYSLRFRNDKYGYFNSELFDEINVFYKLIEKYKVTFTMKQNQGYMINNARFLHGRTEFNGSREMWRILSYDNFLKIKGFKL